MRRRLMAAFVAVAAVAVISATARGEDWPQRPVRIVVGFGPGGGADIIGRIVGQALQEKLGQPFVIENKPGSAGTLGNELVARAEKDGYTLGIMTAGQIIAATINKGLRYDTLTAFEPVSLVATASLLIVARPDFPANDVEGLIAEARAKPDKIVFASAGFGATQHLAAELFMQSAGIKMLHVPFRSSPEAIAAVAGRQVDVLFDTVSALIGQVQSGQLKPLAVTGKDRFPAVPDVPTALSSGLVPGYDVTTWYGVFGPRGMPSAIVAKLNGALNDVLKDAAVRDRLSTAGVVVQGSTPAEFGAFMAGEFKRWNTVREAAGIPQQ
ncbi:MAG: tripartite tricarboxylate transporter substrate binding protein [Bradyrhizobiaceae bacterium]|nr:tripartite tricarboxylate transporter substrate binding protein [Hyphomicrobiales bacterium]MBV9427196.1 tripartite tricarboxylate transporter substrate binding protein [Bradyrhizobiaceae bacterium]